MKHIKRLSALLLAVCMAASLSVSAFAAAAPTVEDLAYLDLENATPELQDQILAARCELVYGDQAWTVNGTAYRILPNGSKEVIPEFSTLFPDWDVSKITTYAQTKWDRNQLRTVGIYRSASRSSSIGYDGVVNLPIASSVNLGYNFYSFTGDGSTVYAYAKTLPGDKYNIAIYDEDLKSDVCYIPNTIPGRDYGCIFDSVSGHRYDCRASSVGMSGHAKMIVEAE